MLSDAGPQFLLDVDNTLLDNDRFAADLRARLTQAFGEAESARYWAIYADLRNQRGYADYLGALQIFRDGVAATADLLQMSAFLLEYPFAERVYPRALEAIAQLRTLGAVAILSDGDIVFQPRKIQRSGLWDAVGGQVLIDVHKERSLYEIRERFPAEHYVMIDDKPNVLAAMKRALGERLTTVFVRQGHYAAESVQQTIDPAPDLAVERIGDICALGANDFTAAAATAAKEHA